MHYIPAGSEETERDIDPVIMGLSDAYPDAAFLFAPNVPGRLCVVDDPWTGHILSYRSRVHAEGSAINLVDARTKMYLCAEPLYTDKCSNIAANRRFAAEWETFRCEPVLDKSHDNTLQHALKLVDSHIDAPRLLKLLNEGRVSDPEAFQSVARILPIDQLSAFAAGVAASPPALKAVAGLYANEALWTDALHAHAQWEREGRPAAAKMLCGQEFMPLENDNAAQDWGSLPRICNRLLRRGTRPRHTACIITSVRNEGVYLLEWLAYHSLLGIERFFVYSNDNTDGSDLLLQRLSDAGLITWIPNEISSGVRPQYKSYGHALKCVPDVLDYEWAAIVDIDEFIRLDDAMFSNFPELLFWHQELGSDSVGMRWRLIGGYGASHWNQGLVIDRFREVFSDDATFVKSFFKTSMFSHANPHFPTKPIDLHVTYKMSSGAPHRDHSLFEDDKYSHAWIDHFYFKSLEESVFRRTLNRGSFALTRTADLSILDDGWIEAMMVVYEKRHRDAADLPARLSQRVAKEVDRLLRLPGMREAYEVAQHGYRALVGDAIAQMPSDARFQIEGSPHQRLHAALSSV